MTGLALALIVPATLTAGMIRTTVGIGAGIFLTASLTLAVTPKFALAVMAVLQLAFDAVAGYYYWRRWQPRLVGLMVPFTLVGIAGGSYLVAVLPTISVRRIIGVGLVGYAAVQVLRARLVANGTTREPGPAIAIAVAVLSGLTSALANVSGVILALYLQARHVPLPVFVGTLTAVQFLQDVFKLGAYWQVGVLDGEAVKFALPFVPLIFAGGWLGALIGPWVSPLVFGRLVLLFVLASGLRLLL